MVSGLKRMTFVVTPDLEPMMDEAKRLFYNKTQSEMIRLLVAAGLEAMKEEKQGEEEDGKKRE